MEDFERKLYELIEEFCGICTNEAHKQFLKVYVNKRRTALTLSEEEYFKYLKSNAQEFNNLIDEAAINETYFFREYKQFELLDEVYLKQRALSAPAIAVAPMTIWSAACSTGEEPISILAFMRSRGIPVEIYATDIDRTAMGVLKNGIYGLNSFRSDGSSYHELLDGVGKKTETGFTLSEQSAKNIHISAYNLSTGGNEPVAKGSVDIIFMRNVFIYFSGEMRNAIMERMSSYLKEGGILLLSINEIASVNCASDIPLVKESWNNVYYFRKDSKKKSEQKDKEQEAQTKKEQKAVVPQSAPSRVIVPPQLLQGTLMSTLQGKKTETEEPTEESKTKRTLMSQEDMNNFLKSFMAEIDGGSTQKAEQMLSLVQFRPSCKEYALYLEALVEERKGNAEDAEKLFQRAAFFNPDFWPARFKLARAYALKGKEKDMRKEFDDCAQGILKYKREGKTSYNELLQSFSPDYFLGLCKKTQTTNTK